MIGAILTGAPAGVFGFLIVVLVIVAIVYFIKRI